MSEMKYSSKRRKTVHQQLCTVASNDPWKDSTGEREDMDEDEDDDMERFDIEDDSDDEEKDSNELKLIESFDTEKIANWVLSISDTLDVSWDSSIKMRIIIHIVTKAKEIGEKVLIVSHSLLFLDFIQSTMFHLGLSLLRIDGNTQQGDRQPLIDRFNQLPYEYVMLISARAGSIGVNIVGASRIILCDLDWNPCHDEQGIGRVYRYGQTKPVFVYRLVTHATIEARLMVQSIHKRGISSQVIDNKKMTPQLQSEMKGYYKLPNKKEMSVPYDSTTPIADTILQSVVENLHMNIFDIQLGDELISQDHEPSIELEESDIRTVQKEVQKAKMQFRASILNKYI
ncbi:P-loop containing nucleoside triphosphate hydrolase protein [Spinellus fusiger]|nr:P-loop containing nucleoside triphosphate hydrolase protein [Spinellus fusiger]